MGKLYNLARMTTATAGTGTITLGAAVSGYLTFALSGAANGDVVSYGIKDGANSEVGTGTYTTSGTTLTRTVTKSTNANAAISLSGTAEVFITPRAEDMTVTTAAVQSDQETAASNAVAVTPGVQHFHPSAVKAWALFNGTAATVTAGYNVSSITRNGTGDYTINWTVAFSSANYAVSGISGPDGGGATTIISLATLAAGSVRINTRLNTGNTTSDVTQITIMAMGDQ